MAVPTVVLRRRVGEAAAAAAEQSASVVSSRAGLAAGSRREGGGSCLAGTAAVPVAAAAAATAAATAAAAATVRAARTRRRYVFTVESAAGPATPGELATVHSRIESASHLARARHGGEHRLCMTRRSPRSTERRRSLPGSARGVAWYELYSLAPIGLNGGGSAAAETAASAATAETAAALGGGACPKSKAISVHAAARPCKRCELLGAQPPAVHTRDRFRVAASPSMPVSGA